MAEVVALVRVEEERHAARAQVPVIVLGAVGRVDLRIRVQVADALNKQRVLRFLHTHSWILVVEMLYFGSGRERPRGKEVT